MTQHEAEVAYNRGQLIAMHRTIALVLESNPEDNIAVRDAEYGLKMAKAHLKRILAKPETGIPYQRS